MVKLSIGILLGAVLILTFSSQHKDDKGQLRLKYLQARARKSLIIEFNGDEFRQYAMNYPRPYDLVIYFTAGSCSLCDDLKPEYEYLAQLYQSQGIIFTAKNPTFFVNMQYKSDTAAIFEHFDFKTVPNLMVSKPKMAVISQIEKYKYIQKFKWSISHNDGHVTTHKLLEFVNQRTNQDVAYKPTFMTMLSTFFGFLIAAIVGVIAYIKLKFIWTNWMVWFVGSLIIYIICVSGVVYDIIHQTPFVGRDHKTGESIIFARGNREQYGAQGFIISSIISCIGMMFLSIIWAKKWFQTRMKYLTMGILLITTIYLLVLFVQDNYRAKSHYNPTIFPPSDYKTGPISTDQGNNI